jgi:hypothetical protein
MAMNQDQIKANLLSITFWMRLLFMLGYALALWVVWIILIVICVVQTVIVLITGLVNQNLQGFGTHTAAYMHQIIRFMVFATEQKPFPFNDFPNGNDDVIVTSSAAAGASTIITPSDIDDIPPAAVVDEDDQSDSYYDPERDSGATR